MQSIMVVGVDFSATAHAALRQAVFMARSTGAELHLVHVIDVFGDNPLVEIFRSAVDEEGVRRELVEESVRLVSDFIADIDFSEVPLTLAHLRAPNVVEALIEYVSDHSADLLVVGAHGRRRVKRLLLGSVAMRLIRAVSGPILVVRSPKAEVIRDPIDRLLVPLDLSDTSFAALEMACRLAHTYEAHMDIVHVVEPYVLPVSLTGIKSIRDLVPGILDDFHADIEELVSKLDTPTSHRIHVLEGSAARTIVDASRELNSDLIVMSRPGVSRRGDLTIGSTIYGVTELADVPVYVIPVYDPEYGTPQVKTPDGGEERT